jgi:hypothetical protein
LRDYAWVHAHYENRSGFEVLSRDFAVSSLTQSSKEDWQMSFRNGVKISLAVALVVGVLAWSNDTGKATTIKGYVLDSACAFTKGLKKPISAECATACAKAGSPLVILTDSGTIYWPIADTTPSSGQNDRLLPFAGQKVTASGKVFERGGSTALVIEKIEAQK